MALPDPTVLLAFGRRVLLTHGDTLCLSDTEYQRYRAQVRDPQWQAAALALPLDERRRVAAQMRHASEQRNVRRTIGPAAADIDSAAAVAWMRQARTPEMVHGHTHLPGSGTFAPGYMRHVLSDWDLDSPSTVQRADVLRFTRDGFTRLPPDEAAQAPPTS
jgi:UDP-2,3-diacylglucosamine hydrolase